MPKLQDIEQFKSEILSLGNEPSIMAGRGETVRDVPQPEEGLSEDLSSLLDEVDQELGLDSPETPETLETSGPEPAPPDLEPPLPPLDDEDEAFDGEDLSDATETDDTETDATETSDLDDFLASFDGVEGMEDEDEAEEPEEPEETVEPETLEDLEEPEESLDDLDSFDLPELDDSMADGGAEDAPRDEPTAGPADEESFDEELSDDDLSFDDFDLPDFEDEESDTPEAEDNLDEILEEPDELSELDELSEPDELSELDELSEPEEPEDFDPMADLADLDQTDSFELSPEDDADETFEESIEESPEESIEEEPESFDIPEMPDDEDSGLAGGGDEEAEELQELGDEEDDFALEEFSLGDLGQDFDLLDEEKGTDDIDIAESSDAEVEDAESGDLVLEGLSEDDFAKVKAALLTLPLNLKLIVEEEIGEKELEGAQLKQLLDALRLGKTPQEIASLVGKITGKRIKLPREYEKRSGVAYEEEKDSFAYRFRYNIFPVIRTAVIAAGLFALLVILGYRYIFRPLYALSLYSQGYEHLVEEEYPVAGAHFDQATGIWPMKEQFYRYGKAYREKGEWARSSAMYERLLRRYPLDKQGSLDYADMLFRDLADYRKAVTVLDSFIDGKGNFEDPDALLLLADINLEWGKSDPERLEDARLALARLMNTYGALDEYLFRMLRFFIRTDNEQEVEILKNRFEANRKLKVDPHAYAELGGYLIDKGNVDEADGILFRAMDVNSTIPEIHYHLSRYFQAVGNPSEELKALNNTIELLGGLPRLNGERHFIQMDSFRRKGENHYRYGQYLEAEEAWRKGINGYEDARARGILPVRKEAGMLYADMANIPYYQGGDLDLALSYLKKARANNFVNTDLEYKTGYIYYRKENFRLALLNFSSAADGFTTDPNLLYAIANTLYQRENLLAAEGYYRSLISRLEDRRASLQDFIPQIDTKHEAILENLIRTNNNLAVTLYMVYQRTGRSGSYTDALRHLSTANELFENFNRDFATLERSGLMNLAYLNQRGMVFPDSQYEPQIYPEIPRDMEQAFFSGP